MCILGLPGIVVYLCTILMSGDMGYIGTIIHTYLCTNSDVCTYVRILGMPGDMGYSGTIIRTYTIHKF